MEIPLLADLIVILAVSIAVLYLFHVARLPAIVGFLLTGVLAGPHGFALIGQVEEVEILAEIGIVLLLFTIGLELSLQSLIQIRRSVLIGGSLQVGLTTAATTAVVSALGQPFNRAIFIGFLVALSSTAIVMKLIQERAEVDSPQGKNAVGILIFQDLAIVPMLLLVPVLAGQSGDAGQSLLLLGGKALLIVALVVVSARWLVPNLLYQIARTRSRELFLFSVVGVGLAVAWLTSSIGLSLALGAFLAGLIISESGYSNQALGNMLPLRDLFTSLFFVSIGMLLDLSNVLEQPLLILLLALGVLFLKGIISFAVTAILRFPIRTAVLVGLALSQVGEFSFILSGPGLEFGLLSESNYQIFLAVSVLTMAATPFIMDAGPKIAESVANLGISRWLERTLVQPESNKLEMEGDHDHLKDHLIIIGYGLNGHHLVRAAEAAKIPFVVVDANPEIVRAEQAKGMPFHWGDATQEAVLDHVGAERAKVAAIGISDPTATRRCTEVLRSINPSLYVLARTHYYQELSPLLELGADEVIPEEFEASIEIFTRVLGKYLIPESEIEGFISEIREGGYEMFRSPTWKSSALSDLKVHMPDMEVVTVRVHKDSAFIGRSVSELDLRDKHHFNLLLIKRENETMPHPDPDTVFEAGDIVCGMVPSNEASVLSNLFSLGSSAPDT